MSHSRRATVTGSKLSLSAWMLAATLILSFLIGPTAGPSAAQEKKAKGAAAKATAKGPSAVKLQEEDDPAEDSPMELDDDLTALVVPAEMRSPIKSMDR